jgi:hypothetical protein
MFDGLFTVERVFVIGILLPLDVVVRAAAVVAFVALCMDVEASVMLVVLLSGLVFPPDTIIVAMLLLLQLVRDLADDNDAFD